METIITFSDQKFYRLDKKFFPSVTTILAHTMPESKRKSLEYWRKKVGEQQAEQIKEEAIVRGQKIHQLLENYANGKETNCPPEFNPFWTQAKACIKSFERILSAEEFLYHPQLKYAGTTDLIAYWQGNLTIVDYNTSLKPKKASKMEEAKIQGTAYSLACEASLGIETPQVLIIVIHPQGTQLFSVEEQDREEYCQKWLARLENYYANPINLHQ